MKFKKNDLICFEAYGVKLLGKVVSVSGSMLLYRSPEGQTFEADVSEVTKLSPAMVKKMSDIFVDM